MPKSERLLNLLILLLVQRHFIPKQRIRETLPPYRDATDEAFERMFDRDKEELRALGVPIEVGSADAFFDDEPGYRIRPDEFALPGVDLTADEAAVVGLATRVWQHAGLASAANDALSKLTANGVEIDRGRLDIGAPSVAVDEPAFDVLWHAVLDRTRVAFDYRRSDTAHVSTRVLEPWGVLSYAGRWYVVGRDVDRDDERLFRLSRIEGPVKRRGRSAAFEPPDGVDLREVAERLAPGPASQQAEVLVRQGAAHSLRRVAAAVETDVAGPDTTTGWDRLELAYASPEWLVGEVVAFGPDAYLAAPEDLRAQAVSRLTAVAGGAR